MKKLLKIIGRVILETEFQKKHTRTYIKHILSLSFAANENLQDYS